MRLEKIWVQQCRATKGIKRRFGAKSALDYLICEKLMAFAEQAEHQPEFAKERPRFLAALGRSSTSTSWPDMLRARNQWHENNCVGCFI
jgi:hypothetical protein